MSVFAERLREAMELRGFTQAKLSATTGLAKSSICQYLAGKSIPHSKSLTKIAEALDVSAEWLNGADEQAKMMPGSMSIADAARLMGKCQQCIREGLKSGVLPFGSAVKMPSGKYTYYISLKRFEEFTGQTV